jgi:hypothetical protein
MRKITKNWKQKDGTKIRICDMTDSHLNNTIALLERLAKATRDKSLPLAYQFSCMIQGEMASMCIEQEIDSMEEDEEGERFLLPIYWDLVKEQERRITKKL